MKEKRPTISPNFNFLGQLLDFEKKINSPHTAQTKLKSLHRPERGGDAPVPPEDLDSAPEAPVGSEATVVPVVPTLEPLRLPCVLADAPEECLLAQALSGLQLGDGPEDSARLKRSFSLDIKSYGEPGGSSAHRVFVPHVRSGDAAEYLKPSAFKDPPSKACQFSPVEEVSEQSTPEESPDKEEADRLERAPPPASCKPRPAAPNCSQQLNRSGSMEENTTSFLFGLSRSQQHLAKPGCSGALKGWHSDILLGPVTVSTSSLAGGWYLSSESTRFYSTSAILSGGGFAAYSCSHGLQAVRRRSRQRTSDRGDSRRSWHEESSFEKQLKRRSCQMEFGDGMTDSRSREEMGKAASQSSFTGSMEVIEVSWHDRLDAQRKTQQVMWDDHWLSPSPCVPCESVQKMFTDFWIGGGGTFKLSGQKRSKTQTNNQHWPKVSTSEVSSGRSHDQNLKCWQTNKDEDILVPMT